MKKERLDKFIANQLILPRSVVRNAVRHGKATVDGVVVRDFGFLIDIESASVRFEGQAISYKQYVYIVMNKPKGVLSASSDSSRKTVVDLVPEQLHRPDIAPVGRLDKDTTGLLIITDDGVFSHNCISPKKKISKAYIAELDGDITKDMIAKFKRGVVLADGQKCAPAILERVGENIAKIVISEGKYHQIKRMFGTVGLGVNALHRESIGGLYIPEGLRQGECIEMKKGELEALIKEDSYIF